ncbi:hypothetical protein AJ78_06200 [Emergomyces pasteurianus Ep9510]|uniref:Uncharacterized protein n=1 Tax=Emergomyces pasteurianus Ep9510 TaxID=1447872 RepID=A0A1J9PBD3_9EURO|nr:hypothetical protein AJ78_06200 [Emergomyces pasteurianus Ep9510]
MCSIGTLIQKVQNISRHTQTLLEYFPNAILWSCLFIIFVNRIPGMNPLSENDDKLFTLPAADDAYRQHRDRRKRVYSRNGVQVLPAIPEEEEQEEHVALPTGKFVSPVAS